jgi:hypothetical protein
VAQQQAPPVGQHRGALAEPRRAAPAPAAPQPDPSPGARDAEEVIQIVRLPLAEFRSLLLSGTMTPVSIAAGYLALEKLRQLGYGE